jgi:nucleoside 2-deoxyribosyltransferase
MPNEQGRPYVYLAGPDVFYPDAMQRAAAMKEALAALGMIGLFPLDNSFDPADFPNQKDLALAIADANEALMRRADAIIANVQPWRGPEADDGTAYEIGFMAALGKPVILHTNDPRPFAERVIHDAYQGKVHQDGAFLRGNSDNMAVEDFEGFADNLMLINAAVRSLERATGEKPDPATVVQLSFEAAADLAKLLVAATASLVE